jgi:hypothetical protein
MNSNRVFLALTAGLLTVAENRLAGAFSKAAEFCRLDASELETGVGAVVRHGSGQQIPLREWIEQRRAEHVLSLFVVTHQYPGHAANEDAEGTDVDAGDDVTDNERPPHMMAGFAGGLPMLLSLRTNGGHSLYSQGTVTGPSLLLTAPLFARLLSQQKCPDFYWEIVLSEVNQFHRCNGREEIESADLQRHLSSHEGEHDWEVIGVDIFREIQVEAFTFDEPFVIPPELAHLVEPVTPFIEDATPYISLEIIDEDVSGVQLLHLIEAQGFSARIWQIAADRSRLCELLEEEYDLNAFPDIAAHDWPDYLASASKDEAWEICEELVELVRLECESTNTQPVIPDDLEDVFGPDEEERRRLHFRGRLQHDLGWWICEVDQPKMFYVLDRVECADAINPAPPLRRARRDFIAALCAIRDFARRIDSPFLDAFEFALQLAAHAEGDGEPDLAALRRSDPDRSAADWQTVDRFTELFAPFGWGANRLLGLAAMSAADVFGAMGSWNDQGFEGDDDVVFRSVSAQLFSALNRYFDATISFQA